MKASRATHVPLARRPVRVWFVEHSDKGQPKAGSSSAAPLAFVGLTGPWSWMRVARSVVVSWSRSRPPSVGVFPYHKAGTRDRIQLQDPIFTVFEVDEVNGLLGEGMYIAIRCEPCGRNAIKKA